MSDSSQHAFAELLRQFGEVAKHTGILFGTYPHEIMRGGIKHAVAVENYHLKAQALGVSRKDADRLLAEARQDMAEWPYWFDATADAERRLMEQYAALMPPPPAEFRRAARDVLARYGPPYTPAEVDRLARWLQTLSDTP